MNKDEIIALLQQQNSFLQEQLQEANRKADVLLEEVTSLRNMLERKSEEAKQKRIIKGLAKITENRSEKQTPTPAPQDTTADRPSEKKERARTNNGAKRKQHLEVEVVEEDVEPEDPRFNKDLARLYRTRDVIRYELIPMRFTRRYTMCVRIRKTTSSFQARPPTHRFSSHSMTARSSQVWHS